MQKNRSFKSLLCESIHANVSNIVYLKEYSGTQLDLLNKDYNIPSFEGETIKMTPKNGYKQYDFGSEFSDEVEQNLNPSKPEDTTHAAYYIARLMYDDDPNYPDTADDLAKALEQANRKDLLIFHPTDGNTFSMKFEDITDHFAKFKFDDRAVAEAADYSYEDDEAAIADEEPDWLTMWKNSKYTARNDEKFTDYVNRLDDMYN